MDNNIPIDDGFDSDESPMDQHRELGGGLVEYALLTALIALVALASLQFVAGATTESVNSSSSAIVGASHP